MADIRASEHPEYDNTMEAMERTTPGHYDQWNRRHKQLLDNDEYLKQNKVDGAGLEFSVTENGVLRLSYDDGE